MNNQIPLQSTNPVELAVSLATLGTTWLQYAVVFENLIYHIQESTKLLEKKPGNTTLILTLIIFYNILGDELEQELVELGVIQRRPSIAQDGSS